MYMVQTRQTAPMPKGTRVPAKARRDTKSNSRAEVASVGVSVADVAVLAVWVAVSSVDEGVMVKSSVGLNLAFSRRCIPLAWISSSILVYIFRS